MPYQNSGINKEALRHRETFRNEEYTERQDFFDASGQIIDLEQYNKRIEVDMIGVLRTAKAMKQETLILGASGCGAFCHNPDLEAEAWLRVLNLPEFKGQFKQIIFAILSVDKVGEGNVDAFQKHFGSKVEFSERKSRPRKFSEKKGSKRKKS